MGEAAVEVNTVEDGDDDDDDDVDDILEEFSTSEGINSNELEHPLTPQPPVTPTQTDTTETTASVTSSETPVIPVTPPAEESIIETSLPVASASFPVSDPLSIENENKKELELMKDINRLQNELKNAATKVNTLQQQLQAMDKYKEISDSYLSISEGASDPRIWFENILKIEKQNLIRVELKNQEMNKKIEKLEKERNDSVVKNAKIEKSILDAKKIAENATKEMKKAKSSEEK